MTTKNQGVCMNFKRGIATGIAAACLMAGFSAEASTVQSKGEVNAAATCKGKSKKTVVRKYYRGAKVGTVLRCGTKNWGYRHLVAKHRWSSGFDKKMRQTVASGVELNPLPGDRTFVKMTNQCPSRVSFKVVTNPKAYSGDSRIKPQGVVTAYAPKSSTSGTGSC